MMLQHLLLDIAPYPRHRIIRYDTVRAVYPPVAKPDTTDTAAAQDFATGVATGGDDMTMLFVGIGVVLFALALCLWFAMSYRRNLNIGLK